MGKKWLKFPKGGGVGGGPTFGKNSQKIPYFFLTGSLNMIGIDPHLQLTYRYTYNYTLKYTFICINADLNLHILTNTNTLTDALSHIQIHLQAMIFRHTQIFL